MMKKIWKIVALTAVIVLLAGAVCIGVSYFLGGSVSSLYENKGVLSLLDTFSPGNIISSITAFFGA